MEPLAWSAIWARIAWQLWPVWIALAVTLALSATFRARLGLYGRLFHSTAGVVGLTIVLFWVFTALFADLIITHDPLAQLSGMRNVRPGTPVRDAGTLYPYYLLGGDALARDVFSRAVMGAREVLKIAPLAAMISFSVGIALGLPAGYFGGRLDTVLTFIANLVLAFPVILLFFLLVAPEVQQTLLPQAMAGFLFAVPILLALALVQSRFHVTPRERLIYTALVVVIGGWIYSGLVFRQDPLGVWFITANLLNVFVAVVFVNAPTVFRIVRGLTMDIKTRDYVAAAQTRGEGPGYIMLWEILPNARGPLIVDFCLRIGYTTILLGTLGFFGLGVSPESPDWGSTINQGRRLLTQFPHAALVPAISLMSLVLGLNLLADGLREESLKD